MEGSRLNNSRTKSPGRSEDKYKEEATGKTRTVSLWRRTHFLNRLTQVYTALMWKQ